MTILIAALFTGFFIIVKQPLPGLVGVAILTYLAVNARSISFRDPLTELHNRRFLTYMRPMYHRCKTLTLIYVDMDGLKHINDTQGHKRGDRMICELAALLQDCPLRDKAVYRLGGDEFLLALTDSQPKDFLSWWSQQAFPASWGSATGPGIAFDHLLTEAEREMYHTREENGKERNDETHCL